MKLAKRDLDHELLAELRTWAARCATPTKGVTRRRDWKGNPTDGRAEWTNALLNFLAEAGVRRRHRVRPRRLYFSRDTRGQGHNAKHDRPARRDDIGEFLCDLVWLVQGTDPEWWTAPAVAPLRLALAVEAEWGALGSLDIDNEYHEYVVAEDFSKLLQVRAETRLLLTCTDDVHLAGFTRMLSRLRVRSGLPEGAVCVWCWDRDAEWRQIGRPRILRP